jgi:hypothetical protein
MLDEKQEAQSIDDDPYEPDWVKSAEERHPVVWALASAGAALVMAALLLGAVLLLVWGAGLAERHLGLPALHCLLAFGFLGGMSVGGRACTRLIELRKAVELLPRNTEALRRILASVDDDDDDDDEPEPPRQRAARAPPARRSGRMHRR